MVLNRKRRMSRLYIVTLLFNLYAEYVMRNAGLEEAHAGIKIARRNINNIRYADNTTLMAESEEELNSLLIKVKEENDKVGLKLNIQKTKILASGPITSWQMDKQWKLTDFIFLGPKSLWTVTATSILRHLLLGRKAMTNLVSVSRSVMSNSLQPPWTAVHKTPLSVHEILQARILEWVAIPFSRVSS